MIDGALRVLIVHNRYVVPGGEEVVVAAEAALLERNGHTVSRFESSNDAIIEMSPMRAASHAIWNRHSRAGLAELKARFKPDIVHFHNTFPLMSPSVYYAGLESSTVVQTLHNFRLVCPAGTLLRAGKPCELCVGRIAWPGVMHGCYRDSRGASLVAAAMVQSHRALGTWTRRVHAYIALTPFSRDIFLRGGLPPEKVHVKPNFVSPDPGISTARAGHFLYVGRFEQGKGTRVLLDAWRTMTDPPALRVIGSGPLEPEVVRFAEERPGVQLLGRLPRERVLEELKQARALVAPSLWYENFPLTICEAMATGCPVIASDLPNVRALLGDGQAGVLVQARDAHLLKRAIEHAAADDAELRRVAVAARALYEAHYTAEANYRMLMGIYHSALQVKKGHA
jgi:glycosyltransferase involved in cell wall biosynthesis